MRVYVYWNLHKHLWSVKALEGPDKGRVVAHWQRVCLNDVRMHVNEAGRQRVLREKRKNVHAGLIGHWVDIDPVSAATDRDWTAIAYNPYLAPDFFDLYTGQPICRAAKAVMDGITGAPSVRVLAPAYNEAI